MEKGLEIQMLMHHWLVNQGQEMTLLSLRLATSLEIPDTSSKKKLNILSCGVQEIW